MEGNQSGDSKKKVLIDLAFWAVVAALIMYMVKGSLGSIGKFFQNIFGASTGEVKSHETLPLDNPSEASRPRKSRGEVEEAVEKARQEGSPFRTPTASLTFLAQGYKARIVTPANNGTASRALFGATYNVQLKITAPKAISVLMELTAKEYPKLLGSENVSKFSKRIGLKEGENIVDVAMPYGGALVGADIVLEVYLQETLMASALYSIL